METQVVKLADINANEMSNILYNKLIRSLIDRLRWSAENRFFIDLTIQKSIDNLKWLAEKQEEYPDATIIVTHNSPSVLLGRREHDSHPNCVMSLRDGCVSYQTDSQIADSLVKFDQVVSEHHIYYELMRHCTRCLVPSRASYEVKTILNHLIEEFEKELDTKYKRDFRATSQA